MAASLPPFFSTSKSKAIPLTVLSKSGTAAKLQALPPADRKWAKTVGFTDDATNLVVLPEADGRIAQVLARVENDIDDLSPWQMASVVEAVPPGKYVLTNELSAERFEVAALGWALGQYRFTRYTEASKRAPRVLVLAQPRRAAWLTQLVEAVALVRNLINTPAEDMNPVQLAREVGARGKLYGAKVSTVVGDDLLKKRFPAVHAVGRAAEYPPRVVDLSWGRKDAPKLSIVGKGVCFDSGGLDIKNASGMRLMKKDMGGAAHALALADMVMAAELDVRLRLIIPAVENAVSGNALRPGDVIDTRKGLSVEVGNTDAEGRLILADALALADAETPDLLIDFATLTGAARVALGPDLPAMFTDDDDLAREIASAGAAVHDPVWRLPLWKPYQEYLSSPVADTNNVSENGFAGAVIAGLFLSKFVERAKSWVHFDIYGWNPQQRPGRPKGGEATALRATFAAIAARYGRLVKGG